MEKRGLRERQTPQLGLLLQEVSTSDTGKELAKKLEGRRRIVYLNPIGLDVDSVLIERGGIAYGDHPHDVVHMDLILQDADQPQGANLGELYTLPVVGLMSIQHAANFLALAGNEVPHFIARVVESPDHTDGFYEVLLDEQGGHLFPIEAAVTASRYRQGH